jgi:hypothetical protein
MNRDDIIRIYSQVSDELCGGTEWCWAGVGEPLQRFAALVAATDREAIATLVEQMGIEGYGTLAIAVVIRRGERR